jgi:hypothetical protein
MASRSRMDANVADASASVSAGNIEGHLRAGTERGKEWNAAGVRMLGRASTFFKGTQHFSTSWGASRRGAAQLNRGGV